MFRCLQLARMSNGYAAPNPMVGAVIVADGRIIGEGYHRCCGEAHAEVNAFAQVKEEHLLPKATLYVSLEPCAHHGKTPPCADLIVRKGVAKVVIGCSDPFSLVAGKGIERLRKAGIEVVVGVLEAQCRELILPFITFHTKHRPYITLKWAQSMNGCIATDRHAPKSVLLSTSISSIYVHKQRALHQAILVGHATALTDNPRLNVRTWQGKQPLRIVIDRDADLPESLHLFDGTQPTLICTAKEKPMRTNVEYAVLDFSKDILPQLLNTLYERKIQSLLVEGGQVTLQSFIDSGLWDEAFVEHGTTYITQGLSAPRLPNAVSSVFEKRDTHIVAHYTKEPKG